MLKVERRPDEDLVRELHGHLKNSQGEGWKMGIGRRLLGDLQQSQFGTKTRLRGLVGGVCGTRFDCLEMTILGLPGAPW